MNFESLPLVKEGESKIVRYLGDGKVAIKLKPTVYSYTYNRAAEIPGSEVIRYECCRILCNVIQSGYTECKHSYLDYQDGFIISQLVYDEQFIPNDCDVKKLPRFCPIEVVVKNAHVGTPKHRYYDIDKYNTRFGTKIEPDKKYPYRMVRYDWRNPNVSREGQRLCDEIMPEELADFYILTGVARSTALTAWMRLEEFLGARGLEITDICFFISSDGRTIFSEITPDCMRVKAKDESLDKDVWRAGGSSPLLMEKWTQFLDMIK